MAVVPRNSARGMSGVLAAFERLRLTQSPAAILDPVKERVVHVLGDTIGTNEQLSRYDGDVAALTEKLTLVAEWILDKVPINGQPDTETQKVVEKVATLVARIKVFLANRPSKLSQISGSQARNEAFAAFLKELDEMRLQYLEVGYADLRARMGFLVAAPRPLIKTTLPARPTVFCGREDLVETAVQVLLGDDPCHIPLLGAGGIGKTTVAAALVHHPDVRTKYGERIIFLSCEMVASEQGLIRTIAGVFGILDDANITGAVLRALSCPDGTLLVLDNLETALDGPNGDQVEGILASIAQQTGLSLIITMRGNDPPAGVVWSIEATLPQLSLDAARQTWILLKGMVDEHLDALLMKLDGLPLAISLMAHQGRRVSAKSLLMAYERENTKLIRRGGGRLKSLDFSIGLSLNCYSMQEEPEALTIFSALCLLPGGMPVDRLAALLPSSSHSVSALSLTVVHVALAYIDQDSQGQDRLKVLSPIRDFMRSNHPPNEIHLREVRHYFIILACEVEDTMSATAGETFSLEVGNLLTILLEFWKDTSEADEQVEDERLDGTFATAQLSHRTGHGDVVPLLREAYRRLSVDGSAHQRIKCIQELAESLMLQHHLHEASDLLEEAQALAISVSDALEEATCLHRLADIMELQDRREEALPFLLRARHTFLLHDASIPAAKCTASLGVVAKMNGHHQDAILMFTEARSVLELVGDRISTAQCARHLADVLFLEDRYDEAGALFQEAIAAFQEVGDRLATAQCLQRRSDIYLLQGNDTEGAQVLEQATELFEALQDSLGLAQCMHALGDLRCRRGQLPEALTTLERAKSLFEEAGDRLGPAQCLHTMGEVHILQERLAEAIAVLEEARRMYDAVNDRMGVAYCIFNLGRAFTQQGRVADAVDMLKQSRDAFQEVNCQRGQAQSNRQLGYILLHSGDPGQAEQVLIRAKGSFAAMGDRGGVAECNRWLAHAVYEQGRVEAAQTLMREAVVAFQAVGMTEDAEMCDGVLSSFAASAEDDVG